MSARSPFLRQLTVLTVLIGGIALGMQMVEAQGTATTEEIALPQGSVFEILAQEGTPQTQYAWVLSLERTFLQAARGRAFRTRFTAPGRYLLSAEIVPPGGKSIRRSFAITVGGEPETLSASGNILETVPPNSNGAIVLGEGRQLVRIRPTPGMLQSITLDADLSTDENGDGDTENDPSAGGTFLASESLPLTLWITRDPPVSFAVAGTQADGMPFLRQFTASVRSSPVPSSPDPEPVPVTGGIAVIEEHDGSLRFRVSDLPTMQTPILPVWDFGDGSQSMLMEPVHSFASSGSYIVRVRVKDLRNGIDIRDLTQTVTVKAPELMPDPGKPIPKPEKPTPEGTPSATSSLFPWLLKILAGLVAAAIIGGTVTIVTLKLRKGKSLAEHLEEADKKMAIGKESTGSIAAAPAPMSLPEVMDDEPKKPVAPPLVSPAAPGPVPSWLQDTPQTPRSSSVIPLPAQTPAPAPKPVTQPTPATTPKPATTPAPTPSPAPVKESTSPFSDATMPDWLTPNAEKKTTLPMTPSAVAAPSPAPVPIKEPVTPLKLETAPEQTPKTPPPPAPVTPPAPTTAPAAIAPAPSIDGALPTWLQPNRTAPMPTKPSAPTPAPAPEKTELPAAVVAPENALQQTRVVATNNAPLTLAAKPTAPESSENTGALPAWLQPQTPKPETSTPKPKTPAPAKLVPVTSPDPAPAPVQTSKGATKQAIPPSATPTVLSDKERERRRLKRQRYRQNKQRREDTSTATPSPASASAYQTPTSDPKPNPDDAPVAFIRAESIEKNPHPNPDPNPQ
ncbi:hypothetical protein A3C37_00475 [Candidatus Peribacteria bacterium RIFCSPHIGHO2_02_FULL_53_20]|nr:MAG: hypothetical protein A3C37_00475 [Candidatus Peribacteria bacterium RIFCSPHIGHO2_02_FULL_53_20]OGJ67851.1 MAG: hypothetical protein A3B61_01280 [Candidatus Peribacteria bacterium RIFCSPLOWO2_01_FULL_53_10]OGJ72178.1 MAG: hypothetical protein A3G69_04565 [Candidatus Peribacteria bacterium RIFCSPLOWO2_12_FULL_53_10]